ncbi:MAG TPA: YtxH domain-containing protein [Polyangia bacterium]|nr:YtxH domain-containing protein [Polyangia bacterium]
MKTLDGDDLLGKLGLATRSSWGAALAAPLGTFGLGLLVGVGIGFMLAPKAGRGLREDIRDRLRGVAAHLDPAGAPDGHSPSAATAAVGG